MESPGAPAPGARRDHRQALIQKSPGHREMVGAFCVWGRAALGTAVIKDTKEDDTKTPGHLR